MAGPRSRTGRKGAVDEKIALVERLVEDARSRGAIKALGERIDKDPELKAQVLAFAAQRNLIIDADLPGKRIVRLVRDREAESRVRGNPIRRDEAFVCGHCGADVSQGGARVRDHCPRCLRSLHVDVVPGDRAAECGGLYDPIAFERLHNDILIRYRCRVCGSLWQGRAHDDDIIPLDFDPRKLPGPASAGPSQLQAGLERARTLPMRVLEAIRRGALWRPDEDVLVAVSGGLDSTVLLELLVELSAAHKGRLRVASVDHGLRPEAAAEVAQVGRRARALGLPFDALRVNVPAGNDLSARARAARWDALRSLGVPVIATAHHADDQAETVLQHLLRGSGARGLRGMQARDGDRVRPLLGEPRGVLEAWARSRGLDWVEDPSNPTSERGRIREVMPTLSSLRGGASASLARSARLLARDDAFLDDVTAQRWEAFSVQGALPWDRWAAEHPAIQLRLLLRLTDAIPYGVEVRADQLEALLGSTPQGGARFGLSAGWSIVVEKGLLRLVSPPDDEA